MAWTRARFKTGVVWVLVDDTGALKAEGGRVPIRYSDKAGAKVYRAGVSRVEIVAGETPRELPTGESADARPATSASSSRGSGFGSAGKRTASQAEAARQSAKETLESLPEGTHVAFTDGSCHGNPGPAGAGAVVRLSDGSVHEGYRALGIATNNVGELTAIEMALELLEQGGVAPSEPVALFTDSKYARGVLVEGWKAKANRELIQEIRVKLVPWDDLEIYWVAGHVGIDLNERADELAGLGAAESSSRGP
jgi:ribonuclease HI